MLVIGTEILLLPSKLVAVPIAPPLREIVLAVLSFVAVAALPVVPFAIFPVIATGLPPEK